MAEETRVAICATCGEPANEHGDFGFRDHAPRDERGDEIYVISQDDDRLALQQAQAEIATLKQSAAAVAELNQPNLEQIMRLSVQVAEQEAEIARLRAELEDAQSATVRADETGHMYRCAKVNGVWACHQDCAKAALATLRREVEAVVQEIQRRCADQDRGEAALWQILEWAERLSRLTQDGAAQQKTEEKT